MPKYQVLKIFERGTDQEKKPGEIIELTEEQAGPFIGKWLAPYQEPKTFAQEVKKHRLLPDEPEEQPAPEPSAFAQEVEKHKLLPDDLPTMTVKQLTALPEWASVPEPKPTRKADIITAIRAVRGE